MFINVSSITRIFVRKKAEPFKYSYQKRKTWFWGKLVIQKEGFSDIWTDNVLPLNFKSNKMFAEGKKIYLKPHLIIYTSDGKSKDWYFESVEFMNNELNYILSKNKFIQID